MEQAERLCDSICLITGGRKVLEGWRPPLMILVVSILVTTWAVSRVFRVGILMTGKGTTIPEILRWLRTA